MKAARRKMVLQLAAGWLVRYAGFVVMTIMAVWCEARPAPHLPDALIDRVPFVASVSSWNYYLWVAAWDQVVLVWVGEGGPYPIGHQASVEFISGIDVLNDCITGSHCPTCG